MRRKTRKENKEKIKKEEDFEEMSTLTILTFPELQNFLKRLPKCLTINSRLIATKNLLDMKKNELVEKFIELKGLSILSGWLKEYKSSVSSGTELTKDEEFIVLNIVYLCDRMHLSINDLKSSKIGKNINSLGKLLTEGKKTKKACEEIVAKWRKMISKNEEEESEVPNMNLKENKNLEEVNHNYISNQIQNFNQSYNRNYKPNRNHNYNNNKQILNTKTKRNQNNFNNNSSKVNYHNNSKMYVNFHFHKIFIIFSLSKVKLKQLIYFYK